jgi:hypothetical protein
MPAIGGTNTTKKHGTLLDFVLAIPAFRGCDSAAARA